MAMGSGGAAPEQNGERSEPGENGEIREVRTTTS
jgi:hypothetical protein